MVGGEKVYYYRIKKGLTQSELSSGICSVSYLSKIENDNIQSNAEILQLLCDRLEINFQDNQTIINELKNSLLEIYVLIKEREKDLVKERIESINEKIKEVEDPTIISLYNLINARYHMLLKDYKNTKIFLQKVDKLTKFFSDELNYYFHSFSGLYYYLNGDLKTSLHYYLTAKKISEVIQINEPEFIYQLAILYSNLGQNSKSIISAYEALADFDKNAIYERSVDCHILLGINYNRIGDDYSAESYLSRALKASKYLPNKKYIQAIIYHNMGSVYSSRGQSEEAIRYFKLSIENNQTFHLQTTYLLANEYNALGESEQAYKWLEEGLKLVDKVEGSHSLKLKILKYELDNNQISSEYQKQLIKSIEYFEKKEDFLNLKECYEKLGHYYSKKFLYKDSSYCFYKANSLNQFT